MSVLVAVIGRLSKVKRDGNSLSFGGISDSA